MACNCNNASKTCDPCAFCTPPGVTGLTTCQPVDPCDEKVNVKCFFYNGEDVDCLGIKKGDDLYSVLLKLLEAYFPPDYCCGAYGTATWSNCFLTGITSWGNPLTTTTTSTSTTTTASPACSFYRVSNAGPQSSAVIQYLPCNCLTPTTLTITNTSVTVCVSGSAPITTVSGNITTPLNLGPCTSPPCPTTTTTTRSSCTCTIYNVVNNSGKSVTITYTACTPTGNQIVSTTFGSGTSTQVCACSDIQQNIQGVTITNTQALCSAPPTTSTTTVDCNNNGGTGTALERFIMDANKVTEIKFHLINNTIPFTVDWGDGILTTYPAGSNYHSISHTYTTAYTGPVTFYSIDLTGITGFYDADYSGSPSAPLWPAFNCLPGGSLSVKTSELSKLDGCSEIELLNTKTTGDIIDLPNNLTRVVIWGNGRPNSANCANTLTGNIANMPPLAKGISILGNNTLTGDIGTLPTPPGITTGYYIAIYGLNTIWGNIANLPTGAVSPNSNTVEIAGNNIITGNIANIPSDYLSISIEGGGDGDHTFGGPGNTIWGNIADINPNVVNFNLRGDNTLTGNLSSLVSTALKTFYLRGKSTITGDVNSMATPNLETIALIDDLNLTSVTWNLGISGPIFPNLKTIYFFGPQTITGNIGGLPNSLKIFYIVSVNSNVTGNWNSLPSSLVEFQLSAGSSSIGGDLKNIPSTIKYFVYETSNATPLVFTNPHTWPNPMQAFIAVSGGAMTTTNLDNLLVSLNTVPTWNFIGSVISTILQVKLKGTPSGTGITAALGLQSKGVTVNIIP